jgi:hypothetical protein
MASSNHPFMFDVNFAVGTESVFVELQESEGAPFPPIASFFLQTDLTPILLTDGTFFELTS